MTRHPASPRLSPSTISAVSSLWTPDGEHRVPPEGGPPPPSPAAPGPQPEGAPGGDPAAYDDGGESPYGGASEEEMRLVAQELLTAPVEDVVANHCYGLFELAALHLSQQPPNLKQARVAIDAMGLIVEGLGERLGQHAATLAEGLNQVRLAFVKISEAHTAPEGDGSSPAGEEPA